MGRNAPATIQTLRRKRENTDEAIAHGRHGGTRPVWRGITSALAEAKTLRVAKQYGLGYIQLMLMEDQKLVEKHAKAAGLGDITVDWSTFRSSDVMNDALISLNLDFAALGPTGIITIWPRTRNNVDVRAASGLNAMAWTLTVRDPAIKSLKDFTPQHRIAVPAVKVSGQATALQIAAAKEWATRSSRSSTR